MSAARRGHVTPAKPDSLFFSTFATITAISREVTHASFPVSISKYHWPSPTLGRFLLVSANLVLVMVLCFYKLDPTDQWQWEDLGYRTGFITSAQLPLVILLASKNNIIGFLSGVGYEKLNWLHRWVSRVLFLNVTIHMSFWFVDWARYDYIEVKLKTDVITQRGFAAWCILLWIVLSSMAPVRRWNYEFFVVQHIVTFVGFLAAVYLHLPAEVKVYIWIPIGLVVFDRFVRTVWALYTNLSIFHPKSRRGGIWTCKATFQPLDSDATRIIIDNPPVYWKAGQHVFLSCHGVAPLQSHPFTIASLPEDGRMEFLVKRKSGSTKRFFAHAEKHQNLPISVNDENSSSRIAALIDGPYGRIRPLQQFDSVCFIAGGSGSTFTMPLMRDLVATWKGSKLGRWGSPRGAATRCVLFIWVIRSRDQYSWFASQLSTVIEDVQQLRKEDNNFEVEISVYVTCDASLTEDRGDVAGIPRRDARQGVALNKIAVSEDEKGRETAVTVESTSSKLSSLENLARKTCGPDGACCCTKIIDDEDNAGSQHQCHCNDSNPAVHSSSDPDSQTTSLADSNPSTISPSPLATEKPSTQKSAVHPLITLLTGRPRPKRLIRTFLEQALGESAVVVCGPRSLGEEVRTSVVSLSDERAVHKGTGAQGVFFHEEVFEC